MSIAMLAGWIGFGMLVLGFTGITLKWFPARGGFYPVTMLLASVAYGVMNYSLAVWPGFWSNIVFGIVSLISILAALGRGSPELTDENLDEYCDGIEEETDDDGD